MKKKSQLLILLIFISCNSQNHNSILEDIFDNEQLLTIDKVVRYYDSFLIIDYQSDSIHEKYINFLKINSPICIEKGNLDALIPKEKSRNLFFESIDKKNLSEFYFYRKFKRKTNKQNGETYFVYSEHDFIFNNNGKFMELIFELSKRSEFFDYYFNSVKSCGGFCPSLIDNLLLKYENINFNKKEERLAFLIPFLFY